MATGGWRSVFYDAGGRLRSGWRIIAFGLLFIGITTLALFAYSIVAGLLVGAEAADPVSPVGLFGSGLATLVAAVAAGWIMLRRVEDRPLGALGFAWTPRTPRELGLGLLIGGGSLAVVVALVIGAGWLRYSPDEGGALAYASVVGMHFVLLAAPAAAEEAIFRGYPFQVLVEAIGASFATLIFSAAFAAAHVFNPNVEIFALLNIFLAGVLLSIAYLRTRSLWFATAVHLGWNWCMASLFDLPVSGMEFFDTPLYEPVAAGPGWATGGAFGPEAGIAGSIAALLAIGLVLKMPGLHEASEMRRDRPIVDRRIEPGSDDPLGGG